MENNVKPSEATAAQEAAPAQNETPEVRPERRIRKSLMAKYPDFKAESDDEWASKEDEYFGEVEDELGAYRASEEQLQEMIQANPELAEVINDMVASKLPFRAAIARHYSQEDLVPKDGDTDFEAYSKEYNDRLERTRKREAVMKEIMANEATSLDNIEKFAKENNLSDEDRQNLTNYINDFFNDMMYKRISPEMLAMFRKAITHDSDVDGARREGEITGRNANIEAKIQEETDGTAGDGIPAPSKGGETRQGSRGRVPGEELFDFLGKRKGI